jgi:hypothetical protein
VGCAVAAAAAVLLAPVPLLILLPVVALSLVGRWSQVLAVGGAATVLSLALVDDAAALGAGTVAERVLAGTLGTALVAWLRERYLFRPGSRHVRRALLFADGQCERLTEQPRLVEVSSDAVVLWAPGHARTRVVSAAAPGGAALLSERLRRCASLVQGPGSVRSVAKVIGEQLEGVSQASDVHLAVLEISGSRSVLVECGRGPAAVFTFGLTAKRACSVASTKVAIT